MILTVSDDISPSCDMIHDSCSWQASGREISNFHEILLNAYYFWEFLNTTLDGRTPFLGGLRVRYSQRDTVWEGIQKCAAAVVVCYTTCEWTITTWFGDGVWCCIQFRYPVVMSVLILSVHCSLQKNLIQYPLWLNFIWNKKSTQTASVLCTLTPT